MKKYIFFLIIFVTGYSLLFADSPLTSTNFYRAYSEINIIKEAKVKGILNYDMAVYLSSGSVSLDLKAALINALSWNFDGKYNAELYRYYLCIKHGMPLDNFDNSLLLPDELFSLGYLKAMDDYFDVNSSIALLESALDGLDNSLTAKLIYKLVQAQELIQGQNFSGIWPMFDELINEADLRVDIRPAAVSIIMDYMILYKE